MFYKQNKRMIHYLLIGIPFILFLLGQIMDSIFIYSLLAIGLFLISIALLLFRMNKMLSHKETQHTTQTQNQSRQLELVVEQLRTLITFLPYPMILVDQQGTIELKNNSFELLLNDSSEDTLTITSTNIPFPIKRLLNDSYLNEESVTKTIALNTVEYQCISIPITQDSRYKGSLIVMQDITKLLYQERVQKRFVADASHELKTPITAIKGMVEILMRPEFDDQKTQKDFMEQISAETERLEIIVNDLLYLSKLNSKTILLNKQPLDVYSIVSESLRTFKVIINQKNIDVEIINDNKEPLIADPTSLTTIFNNLIDNVCSYSQASKLTIYIDADNKDKIIRVEDNGVGIEEEDFTRIFERFYRVDDARNRSTGGSGLGLSIVKELVEAHGGSVRVESTKNEFTRFIITLPKLTKS
jgi:two-component system phosphate regulon sensor histidine kinase PhoR